VFATRVRDKIFGHKRVEGTGGWRKLHSGELRDVHCKHCAVGSFVMCTANTVHQMKDNEMGGACGTYGVEERKGACRAVAKKFRKGVNLSYLDIGGRAGNITMALWQIGRWWIGLMWVVQDRKNWWAFVNMVMNIQAP
jgi:hypothetical protein